MKNEAKWLVSFAENVAWIFLTSIILLVYKRFWRFFNSISYWGQNIETKQLICAYNKYIDININYAYVDRSYFVNNFFTFVPPIFFSDSCDWEINVVAKQIGICKWLTTSIY